MKYKINWMENKEGRSGKKYVVMHLLDEAGKETQNVSTFELTYTLAQEIEGEIVQNGQYLNWKPKLEAPGFMKKPNMDRIMEKKQAGIAESQETKAKNIAEAQDRSAWMWAKTNASTLIANNPVCKEYTITEIFEQVEILATKIYNSEPLTPFN